MGLKKTAPKPRDQPLELTPPGLVRFLLDWACPRFHQWLTNIGTLVPPAELKQLDDYVRELRASTLDDLKLKIYLPLDGRDVSPDVLEPNFIAPIPQVVREVEGRVGGGDSVDASIAAESRRSRVVRKLHRTILKARDPLILLGDPGTGKTMTLQCVVLSMADAQIRRVFPIVPVYVRLGKFNSGPEVGPNDVIDYVKESVPTLQNWIDALDRAGRLVILFDGMDEMSRKDYARHVDALSRFAEQKEQRTRTVFSCRKTEFLPGEFLHRRLVLLPFNRGQIAEYLRLYLGDAFPLTIDGEHWDRKPLAQHLAVGDLPMEPSNPFVLWLFCFYIGRKHCVARFAGGDAGVLLRGDLPAEDEGSEQRSDHLPGDDVRPPGMGALRLHDHDPEQRNRHRRR